MEKDFRKVYSTVRNYQAQIIKDLLESNDIKAVILNQKDSELLIGEIEIYVHMDDEKKAKNLIKEF